MPYKFTQSEIDEITEARNLCPVGDKVPTSERNWAPFYRALSRIIGQKIESHAVTGRALQDMKNAKLWLDVAVHANDGTGMHADFIRTFTSREGLLRRGKEFDIKEMQYASNGVAMNLCG